MAKQCFIETFVGKRLKFRARTMWSVNSQVRSAVHSLDETLVPQPQMFSHCRTSQESQVVMERVLIDSVLSLHHFAFEPPNKGEKHVRAAVKRMWVPNCWREHLESTNGNRGVSSLSTSSFTFVMNLNRSVLYYVAEAVTSIAAYDGCVTVN